MKKTMQIWYYKNHTDEYQHYSEEKGYKSIFIPVLDQTYTDKELILLLQQPPPLDLKGIIITSQRTVTTLQQANGYLTEQQRLVWQGIPLYIVGEKTATLLETTLKDSLFFLKGSSKPTMIVKDHAKSLSEALLNTTSITTTSMTGKGHLLYLAGDKRREELPTLLKKEGYELIEIQTYCTCQHRELAARLESVSSSAFSSSPKQDDWSVFFSPSGINYILTCQPSLFHTKIAAIGQTTANHLQQLGYKVHAIASKPNVQQLLDAMIQYDISSHS
ncbi:tetrapyrrole biosynthesis, uroporphyrinogen III synthase [Cunninghamella echinulata]|nr:tetrapyrrole biosynthesis, uroporphyrinogen III synthase [Cunninghamella echinulata]